ncbi:MAG: transporter, family, fosmidomycin resistance protein [Gammaproteobacteria bacterium]|jgi:FSR family fosmidomycin resistance protein-like MFS transporter|nr:transporter, family, fosmidomycin resistance protein [Gammaproteobacteria bacterium]
MDNSIGVNTGAATKGETTRFKVLGAISFSHFLNDMIQSLIIAIYPLLKGEFALSFMQIGSITLTYQLFASVLQPLIGIYTDKHPKPYSLSVGMGFTLVGLVTLAWAPNYAAVLGAAALVGTGSSVFHPESSRIARLASGGRHGLAQSIFQVGGNAGSAMGPLLAAWIIIPHGRTSVAWFSLAAMLAITVLWHVGGWYRRQLLDKAVRVKPRAVSLGAVPPRRVAWSVAILLTLIFSKYFYMASITSYYSFYLIEKFHLSVQSAQLCLFIFLLAAALGTLFGGPIGDRVGRKRVIWFSILGVAPFSMLLPYVDLLWTGILSFFIGLILASAFSAILVFAQELMPGKVGAVSGLFFGFAFGMGGIGAAVLGSLADLRGIEFVYRLCAFLPLLGTVAAFLPDMRRPLRDETP